MRGVKKQLDVKIYVHFAEINVNSMLIIRDSIKYQNTYLQVLIDGAIIVQINYT